jgi:hypothetical protein
VAQSIYLQSTWLSFQSSELGPLSLARECCSSTPLGPRGRHNSFRGSGEGTQFGRRDRHSGTLCYFSSHYPQYKVLCKKNWDRIQSHIRQGFLTFEEIREDPSVMTLHLSLPNFPILFNSVQCTFFCSSFKSSFLHFSILILYYSTS